MKKILLILSLSFYTALAFSQLKVMGSPAGSSSYSNGGDREVGTTTKSGQVILPQAGDIAIGIDATGFLEYIGNSFNNTSDNSARNIFSFDDNVFGANSIYGKYFMTDKTAIRVKLHIGIDSYTDKRLVRDDRNSSDPEATVEDSRTVSNTGLGLRVGYEVRRGYGRLQGFFGPEVGLGFTSNGSVSYNYGNKMDTDGATFYDFYRGGEVFERSRYTEYKSGSTIQGLVGGFAGVEYFVAPKLAIGGEIGLGLYFANQGKGSIEQEEGDGSRVNTYKKETGGSSSFSFSTSTSAALTATFHF